MGNLKKFNLQEYIDDYKVDTFLETGTWLGEGLEYANSFKFKKLFSIELLDKFYKINIEKFKEFKNVNLIHNNSIEGIKEIFNNNNLTKNKIVYWLDAHLPDFYDNSFTKEYQTNTEISIPLEEELKLIKSLRNISKDVFIIDDLRIYEKGNYQNGEWFGVINKNIYSEGTKFVFDILEETHNIYKIYDDEGYILCLPKNK